MRSRLGSPSNIRTYPSEHCLPSSTSFISVFLLSNTACLSNLIPTPSDLVNSTSVVPLQKTNPFYPRGLSCFLKNKPLWYVLTWTRSHTCSQVHHRWQWQIEKISTDTYFLKNQNSPTGNVDNKVAALLIMQEDAVKWRIEAIPQHGENRYM